jgi:hypothetical protein
MPDELDEFEIRTRQEGARETESLEETGLPRPPSQRGPVLLALAAVVLLLAAAVFVFRYQPWKAAPRPTAPTPTPASSAPRPAAPPSSVALPSLDASDAFVRTLAVGLSARPELARWLAQSSLVRTLTAVVSDIADGETPRPLLSFLAPRQRFRALGGAGRRVVADPAGFAGYDAFADAVASLDAPAAVGVYRTLEPLFDAAYRELGHPEGFRAAVDRAIEALVAVPVLPSNAELVPRAAGFRWADPRLEALSAAQKQFLRIGPRNEQLVQAKLREIRAALAAPPARLPEAPSDPPVPAEQARL